ncbi:MAG: heat-inducible transcriptional repressor HrcA [Metamycoplasmataceae bacterium]
MKPLTEREKKIFKLIVFSYIENGLPLGSTNLIQKYNLSLSSATIRNVMASLEKKKIIEKTHSSSGRIPTTDGLKFYTEHFNNNLDDKLYFKIKDIFSKRRINIEDTIDEAAKLISDISGLTLVTSNKNANETEVLKSITLTKINKNEVVIVLITSIGRIINKTILLTKTVKMEDLRIAVRIFQERLIDSLIIEIRKKLEFLSPILKKEISNYDELIEAFVNNVFYFEKKQKNKVFGENYIIQDKQIEREKITEIIHIIENKSIWEMMEEFVSEDEQIKISISNSNNISLISKRITIDNKIRDISIIGTKKMDYSIAKNFLNTIEEFIKKEKN